MAISDIYDDLDAAVAGDEPDYDTEPETPDDQDHANRLLRRYARVLREVDAVNEVYDAEIERIEVRRRHRLDILDGQKAWLAQALEMYHRARLADDPNAKSIELPNGTLKSRRQQPEWTFDPDVFVAWAAEHHPDLVRVPAPPAPAPDKVAAKKALSVADGTAVDPSSGEVVPGVTVEERGPSFTVEVDQ